MLMPTDARRPPDCPSELTFDEWHAGELDAGEELLLEQHVTGCARCRARARRLREGDRAYLALPASRVTLEKLRQLAPRAGAGKRRGALGVRALLAATLIALIGVLLPQRPLEGTRPKGGVRLGFFVKRGDAVFRGGPGERLRPGDLLRFTLRPGRTGYLAILSRDPRGRVSIYYPAPGASQVPIARSADEVALDTATELDDSLGSEALYSIFCASPVPVEELHSELAARGKLLPREGCQLDWLRLYKEARSR